MLFGIQHCLSRQKKSFILVEVLVTLSLATCLILLLFRSITSRTQEEAKMKQIHKQFLEQQQFQTRLQHLFIHLATAGSFPPLLESQKTPYGSSLQMLSQQEIDPDPLFNGVIASLLYKNDQDECVLDQWPLAHPNTLRREVLASNIISLSFLFWGGSEHLDVSKPPQWHALWSEHRSTLPSSIQVCLETQQREIRSYPFLLPLPEPLIDYTAPL
jgi:type II secretory pathway pseudopilin PulG